jgi:hypothetical protein
LPQKILRYIKNKAKFEEIQHASEQYSYRRNVGDIKSEISNYCV